ncbi:GNAT family N-acetyltransferase [Candidatus Woesearchaeota archaeon]|nr:GNAT family N-acetyltransferase [Candidatus Woesearchaeota archaeon]
MAVRRARPRDLEGIYNIVKGTREFEASKNTRFFKKQELKEWISDRKSSIVLVSEEGKINGFLFAKIISRNWCMLDSIAVSPDHRGKGCATRLLDKLYKELKAKKCDYIQALVLAGNKQTRGFWRKKGYSEGNKFVWIEKFL